MEILRLLIITLICVLLFKPEIVTEIPHTQPPHVVILTDASGSMLTRDVKLDDNTVITRADWLSKNSGVDRWKPLEGKGKVTVENFARASRETHRRRRHRHQRRRYQGPRPRR